MEVKRGERRRRGKVESAWQVRQKRINVDDCLSGENFKWIFPLIVRKLLLLRIFK